MKEKIQKVFRQNIPFVVVFVAALIWHLVIKISAGDDVVYFQTLMDGRSIWEILAHRYATWSSRNGNRICTYPVGTGSMAVEDTGYYCFYIDSCILYRLLFLIQEKYLDMECNINKTAGKWLVCAFMLLYPFSVCVSRLDRDNGQLSVAASWVIIHCPAFTETGTERTCTLV